MLIKFLLKIWPALIPFLLYFLWILLQKIIAKKSKSGKFIEGQYQEVRENENSARDDNKTTKSIKSISSFSLKNPQFVAVIYLSLILMIMCFLYFAFTSRN